MTIKKRIIKIRISLIALFLILSACSTTSTKKQGEYITSEEHRDKFPSSTVEQTCENEFPCYIVELKPETLFIECSLRNDSPYYWCYLEGVLSKEDPELPSKVGTVIRTVMGENVKKRAVEFVKRLKSSKKSVFLITSTGYFITDDNKLSNQAIGLYSEDECLDINIDFSACKESKRKLDIYTGKYY